MGSADSFHNLQLSGGPQKVASAFRGIESTIHEMVIDINEGRMRLAAERGERPPKAWSTSWDSSIKSRLEKMSEDAQEDQGDEEDEEDEEDEAPSAGAVGSGAGGDDEAA